MLLYVGSCMSALQPDEHGCWTSMPLITNEEWSMLCMLSAAGTHVENKFIL